MQQHHWNCPVQISGASAPNGNADALRGADAFNFEVRPGDVVVAASDGAFDNLYLHDLARLVGARFEAAARAAAAKAGAAQRAAPRALNPKMIQAFVGTQSVLLPFWVLRP